ncbi:putative 1,4-alpha-glucan branching enzyme [Cryptosporidium serpentis]
MVLKMTTKVAESSKEASQSKNSTNCMASSTSTNVSCVPTAANSPISHSSSLESVGEELKDIYEVLDEVPYDGKISDHDLYLLDKAEHPQPFGMLGYQKFGEDLTHEYFVVRAWIRNAKSVYIRAIGHSYSTIDTNNIPVKMEQRYLDGKSLWLFEKAFKILKNRISVARNHYCGYEDEEGFLSKQSLQQSVNIRSNNEKRRDLTDNNESQFFKCRFETSGETSYGEAYEKSIENISHKIGEYSISSLSNKKHIIKPESSTGFSVNKKSTELMNLNSSINLDVSRVDISDCIPKSSDLKLNTSHSCISEVKNTCKVDLNSDTKLADKFECLLSSSSRPRSTVNVSDLSCSTDKACNRYIHDNVNSSECVRKLYYEYIVEYEGDSNKNKFVLRDAYSFGLLLTEGEMSLFQSGSCWHVDNILGSHIMEFNGVLGTRFTVWAPHAKHVSVVGDWNGWDGRANPMRSRYESGIWELFIPHLGVGEKYGYQIHSITDNVFVKIDPYAQEFEIPPKYASIISNCDDSYKDNQDKFKWEDDRWMSRRLQLGLNEEMRRQPMSIYEVHLPSWMRKENGDYLGYREIAERLVKHVGNLNFTYVEFLPLAQHPFEGSWGYQVTGQYAPYSRLGNPDDFKYLVNELHKANIGVFIDFVPAHFCKDSWGLVYYDGTPTYEYGDPREGEHKGWGTAVFNFRRNEVRSFLLGAAYHWLRRYHIDGLRIDAVSSMLYRNYLRPNGEWIPNEFGGDANLEAVSLLQELNWVIHKEFPGVFTMAEESTAWKGVTQKGSDGLGFDAKWDLGWMNDTLSYLYTPPDRKHTKHNKLTFRGLYMAHENWVLPLSHDEVVNGKGSLLDKCGFTGAPYMDRIRTMKALFGYQIGMPGRPLLFQGAEIAQGREWKESRSVDWHEGEEDIRKKVCIYLSDLLNTYKTYPSLHAGDDESWNFQWVDCENSQDCIIAFLRKYKEWSNDVVVICNFNSRRYYNYPIGVPHGNEWIVLINSDDWKYGGSMFGPGNECKIKASHGGRIGWPYSLWLDIPEFSCILMKPWIEDEYNKCE